MQSSRKKRKNKKFLIVSHSSILLLIREGYDLPDIYPDIVSLFIYSVAMLSLATWRYRKTE